MIIFALHIVLPHWAMPFFEEGILRGIKMREFTLAEMIRSFAQVKTVEKSIALPGGRPSTSFDPECQGVVVTFAYNPEDVI